VVTRGPEGLYPMSTMDIVCELPPNELGGFVLHRLDSIPAHPRRSLALGRRGYGGHGLHARSGFGLSHAYRDTLSSKDISTFWRFIHPSRRVVFAPRMDKIVLSDHILKGTCVSRSPKLVTRVTRIPDRAWLSKARARLNRKPTSSEVGS